MVFNEDMTKYFENLKGKCRHVLKIIFILTQNVYKIIHFYLYEFYVVDRYLLTVSS